MTPERQPEWVAALQDENDKYLAWKTASAKLQKLREAIRDEHIQQAEAAING